MNSWKEFKLGEVIEIIGGGTPKTSISEYWNGNIPWLSVVDFNTGKKYVSKTEKTITEQGLKNSSTKLLQKNDIIISARGTVGALAMLDKPMTFNQSCYGIRAKENESTNDYIFYLLKDIVKQLLQISHGGVFDTITKATFDEIDISLPPLEEQKAIAEILSSLDDKIDLLHRQNQTLESLAQTLFRQWFIEEAKEEWEVVTLGDLGKVVTGKTPSTSNEDFWGENVLFITPTDFKNYNKYAFSSDRKLSTIGKDKVKNCVLPKNSILVTCIGSDMGKVVITKNECVTNQQINSLVLSNDNLLNEYVFQYLKSIYPLLRAIALGGTTMPIINKTDFENIEILLPTDEVLEKFQSITVSSNQKIIENTKQIKTLEKLRDTLLPKLLSGDVRVNN